jgi:YD repeat-containing protein
MGSLVVPSVQRLDGGQQALDAERARRANPEAVTERERSRTEFAKLHSAQAVAVARKAFPGVIEQPAGGLQALPAGTRVRHYITPNAALMDLPDDKRGVVESSGPIARETDSGTFTALNLRLAEGGGYYSPIASDVAVQIPRHVNEGIGVRGGSVSLTPVDARGASLRGSEGLPQGASVLYANTLPDADTVVKPTATGFQLDAILRSPDSPNELRFRVGMPANAHLEQKPGSDVASVLQGGQAIAAILAPGAHDAAGSSVPLSMRISGEEVVLTLGERGGEYQYPIEVDPESYMQNGDGEIGVPSTGRPSNWEYQQTPGAHFTHSAITSTEIGSPYNAEFIQKAYPNGQYGGEQISATGAYSAGQSADLSYETQGDSQIFEIQASTSATNSGANIESYLEFEGPPAKAGERGQHENSLLLSVSSNYARSFSRLCNGSTCEGYRSGQAGNVVRYEQAATGSGSSFSDQLWTAQLLIGQPLFSEAPPTVVFDSANAGTMSGWRNVLYGGGSWMSKTSGAVEYTAKDKGIGISGTRIEANTGSGGWHALAEHNYMAENDCRGIQCYPEHSETLTYNASLKDGYDSIRVLPRDEMDYKYEFGFGTTAEAEGQLIKVDTTAPHGFKINGLSPNQEMSAAPHRITIEATDGTAPTPSSGIRSISAKINGKELGKPAGSCSLGPCTASGEWTINGESLGAGVHKVVVTAVDNAGNVAEEELTFAIRNATPVALGPGTVGPTTGQLALSATDVSLSGVGGISRTYHSRALTAGAEGPLGPQWGISLGSAESLQVLPDGTAALTGSVGELTVFPENGKGGYESPQGDGNLAIERKEKEKGKGASEYVLKNATAGTSTTFTQPSGSRLAPPTYWSSLSGAGSGGGPLVGPAGVSTDTSGDVWVAESKNERIAKYSPVGLFMAAYGWGVSDGKAELESCTSNCQPGLSGSGYGEFYAPSSVAVNPSTGNVYVSDRGNNRIEELSASGGFIAAFGSPGAGNGQLNSPCGVTLDSSGNVWVADLGNGRVEEFSATGSFLRALGSGVGSGEGQMGQPVEIAFSGGNLYVSDYEYAHIDEFSTSGAYIRRFASEGAGNGQFVHPYGLASDSSGNLYVADSGNARVEEFTATGTFVSMFGTKGTEPGQFSDPTGIAISAMGTIYVTDGVSESLDIWSRPTWVPTISEGPAATGVKTYAYKTVTVEGKPVTEPSEELGLKPAGVTCVAGKMEKGCRALSFTYAEKTTASGENASNWGEYNGRLMKVSFTAYNPVAKEMQTVPVAQYTYDAQGRLRGEWDPRVSPALKTTYGYDAEGHVTAVDTPGQQPWLLHYGTFAGDPSTGRLLSLTRPSAATAIGNGNQPQNTAAPVISGVKPVVGTMSSVTGVGSWSNTPLAYSYQWEDCNSAGGECVQIPGAVNRGYYPVASDVGHTLVVQVSAYSGAGTASANSAATAVVASGTPSTALPEAPNPGSSSVWTVDYQVPVSGTSAPNVLSESEVAKWGQKDDPVEGTAIFPPDEPMGWPARDYKRARLDYLDIKGRVVNIATPNGGIATTEYNETNEVMRSLSADNRATALKKSSKALEESKLLDTESVYNAEGSELLSTVGPQHPVKLSTGAEVNARSIIRYYYDEGAPSEGGPYDLVTKTSVAAQYSGKEEDQRTTTTSYSGQSNLGWKLRRPTSVATEAGRVALVHTTVYDQNTGDVVETRSPAGSRGGSSVPTMTYQSQFGSFGAGNGQLNEPKELALASGALWVADQGNNRIEQFNEKGEWVKTVGSAGTGNGQFKEPKGIAVDAKKNIWVADAGNNRIEELNEKGEWVRTVGSAGTGSGQFKEPKGIAVDANGNVWVADAGNSRIEEFNEKGEYVKALGSAGTGNAQLKEPRGVAVDAKGNVWAADTGNSRVEEFNEKGEYVRMLGSFGSGNGQFKEPKMLTFDNHGNLWITDAGNNRVEEFNEADEYQVQFGSEGAANGQFREPLGVQVDASGDAYVSDANDNRIEKFIPGTAASKPGAHDLKSFYYTAGAESEAPACRNHPEWVSLPCQIQPAEQPAPGTAPELPVTSYTYSMWDAVEATNENFGSTLRTKKQTFDGAGRLASAEVSSSADTAVPAVKYEYDPTSGALVQQSIGSGETAKSLVSAFDSLGQLTSYTDADGNTAKYTYDVDGRIEEVSDAKGSQAYSYDTTTGDLSKLRDSAAGTFSASYDDEGKLATETYPNTMKASYTYNAVGATTAISYVKEKATWFSDAVVPSIHGEALAQRSTLATEAYSYDTGGRLTQTQETPVGKGCTTRLYGYDEESNRTSSTTRESGSAQCATEGGTTEAHVYDEAERLIDGGIRYDALGNITKVPAADAGGSELSTAYDVDGQVAHQSQNGETFAYGYDPAGRTREKTASGNSSGTTVLHYMGGEEALSWTSESSGKWTRNIPGIAGELVAIQSNGEEPVLQVHDLRGNIVATAALGKSATKLLSSYNSTEFGVPSSANPPRYSWLGAGGLAGEFATGVTTQQGATYVPQLGRSLQTAGVVPPGATPNGSGPGAPYVSQESPWALEGAQASGAEAPGREAARLKALQEEAERKAREAAERAAAEGGGGSPAPGEPGEGGGGTNGEIGDPISCNVTAWEPYTEESEWTGHKMYGTGAFSCRSGLPSKTWFEECFDEGGSENNRRGCKSWGVAGETEHEQQLTTQCKVGLWYTFVAWLWHNGEGAIKNTSSFGLCEENMSEFVGGGEIKKILGG